MGALSRAFGLLGSLFSDLAQADLYWSEGDTESARFMWGAVNQTVGRRADDTIPPQDWSAVNDGDA